MKTIDYIIMNEEKNKRKLEEQNRIQEVFKRGKETNTKIAFLRSMIGRLQESGENPKLLAKTTETLASIYDLDSEKQATMANK
jgi:phosphomevalonate kinase